MQFLNDTLPANQYPLTWLLPSGKLFIQAGFKSMTFDPVKNIEIRMDDVPIVVRAYPASAATTMLPLTPANQYTATVLMCGGSSHNWHQDHVVIPDLPTDNSCVKITPDVVGTWEFDDPLDKGRTMGQVSLLFPRVAAVSETFRGMSRRTSQSFLPGEGRSLPPRTFGPRRPQERCSVTSVTG